MLVGIALQLAHGLQLTPGMELQAGTVPLGGGTPGVLGVGAGAVGAVREAIGVMEIARRFKFTRSGLITYRKSQATRVKTSPRIASKMTVLALSIRDVLPAAVKYINPPMVSMKTTAIPTVQKAKR